MSYFGKLSEDERMQELVYHEYRRKMDYRLQAWIEEGIEQDIERQTSRKKGNRPLNYWI
ncbi:MAG: hypothetical protein GDA46_02085 [Bdellovibrionales bacterium]|nr:hypothetical protein [Bdellovibrionales bacterium]